ncbi:SHOCT domain-containing protein [Hymenobacter sp. CRA2]|uniref:SHOCT domain-containing protein n=1 Tax=Hymenobacter sp. CRA2 TaxID=1955620 RepID=UPI00098F129E|nr:SHOCT domain-containing protein [Hymenobacter sp. CRA2]OON67985.1 hypothetical protein B0919_15065 [Hymenobacter sp. CRA2]
MDKNDSSPLETLRQLKEWLDAGTITQQEFNALKQKLLFPDAPSTPAGAAASSTVPPLVPPPTAPVAAPPVPPTPLVPPAPESHVVSAPVEDPLLPLMVETEPVYTTAAPPTSPDYFRPAPPVADLDGPEEEPQPKSPLATVLIIGGIVLLLAVVGYLVLGNRNSERLTSSSITAADTTATPIEEGPQAEQLTLPPVAAPETVRVQPNVPAATLPTDTAAGTSAADAAAAEAATRARVQRTLTALYSDLQTAPFTASQYFAPQVERFYSLQNTTPAAIEAELNRTHFPEFTEAKISFDPATLQISQPAEDGSVTVTYQERGRSLRKTLNQYQQTLAQVRARFDRNGQLTYFRQERLLQNSFTDAPKPAAPTTPPATDGTPPADQQ